MFLDNIKAKAKQNLKTIVLPEGDDERTKKAVEVIEREGFAKVIVLNDKIVAEDENLKEYAHQLYEMRKNKGLTEDQAYDLIKNPLYFGTMMVKLGKADGMVAGACHSSADVLRPPLQILKTAPGCNLVSSFFVMHVPNSTLGHNGTFGFADCALNINPTAEELAEIAISSAASFECLVGAEPRVAMLSYSTMGSGKGDMAAKVTEATKLAKSKAPQLALDGELQLDAAIIEEVGKLKAPDSPVAGKANVLVFPDLNAANIGYKLVQRLAKAEAYGPISQGIAKPVNDLSRGCSSDDIVGVVALTALQATIN
jgi:phosphate acetyltransferase